MKNIFTALFFIFSSLVFSQNLQLEEIMKGNEFIGHQPSNQRWSVDGKTIYFEWNPNNDIGDTTYYWQSGFTEPKLLSNEGFRFSEIQYQGQENFDVVYYTNQGALFSYHKKTKENKPKESKTEANIEISQVEKEEFTEEVEKSKIEDSV